MVANYQLDSITLVVFASIKLCIFFKRCTLDDTFLTIAAKCCDILRDVVNLSPRYL